MKRRARNLVLATIAYRRAAAGRGPTALIARKLARLRVNLWNTVCGADIDPRAELAPDLALPHPNGVVVHEDAVVGSGCMIMQQVTLGQLENPGAPIIGAGVYIGAGAKLLGAIRVGDGARIGANAVVLSNVPAGATVVGIPAHQVDRRATHLQDPGMN